MKRSPRRVVAGGGGGINVYGCYFAVSRAALLPLAYDEDDWPLLDWCREVVTVRGLVENAPYSYMKRQKGTKTGAKYNNDHLLSYCLQPSRWGMATGMFSSLLDKRLDRKALAYLFKVPWELGPGASDAAQAARGWGTTNVFWLTTYEKMEINNATFIYNINYHSGQDLWYNNLANCDCGWDHEKYSNGCRGCEPAVRLRSLVAVHHLDASGIWWWHEKSEIAFGGAK
eukprot:FR738984.1.p1 GENE.FR738984.1~~FR738984.1.p1  ORF type:complete len:237 (+),score=11.56 FR738984.1:28-711(+)